MGSVPIYKEQLQNKREPWEENISALHEIGRNIENLQIETSIFKGKIL